MSHRCNREFSKLAKLRLEVGQISYDENHDPMTARIAQEAPTSSRKVLNLYAQGDDEWTSTRFEPNQWS